MELDSLLCPICSLVPEEIDHALWSCQVGYKVWVKVYLLVDVEPHDMGLLTQMVDWVDNCGLKALQ